MRPVINVVDMFHGDNHEKMPNFRTLKSAGVLAVIHKASQGSGYKDPLYLDRATAAMDAGLLVGAYHFLDASPVAGQTNHFLECSHITDKAMSGNLLLACDYERWKPSASLQQCYEFMVTCDRETPGLSTVLYSGDLIRETLRPHVAGHQSSQMIGVGDFFYKHRLWLAQYGPSAKCPWPWNGDDGDTKAPGVWLWQFTEKGRIIGLSGDVDGNYYAGDPAQLADTWVSG